jgi:hypothetical protein
MLKEIDGLIREYKRLENETPKTMKVLLRGLKRILEPVLLKYRDDLVFELAYDPDGCKPQLYIFVEGRDMDGSDVENPVEELNCFWPIVQLYLSWDDVDPRDWNDLKKDLENLCR